MSTDASAGFFLNSRLARYTFLLFTGAALLPIVYIAYLSYDRVSEQLREQSFEQSRQLSKSLGMELMRRLNNTSRALQRIAQDYAVDGAPDPRDQEGFATLSVTVSKGISMALKGAPEPLPGLDASERAFLMRGKTLLLQQRDAETGRASRLLLLHRVAGDDDLTVAVATLPLDLLSTLENLMPGSSSLLLLGQEEGPEKEPEAGSQSSILYSSSRWLPAVTERLHTALDTAPSGYFAWQGEEGDQLAAYWSLFTAPELHLPNIVVLVSADQAEALAAIARFRSVYLPVLVLVLLSVALVTARQLRRRLMPLVELRNATQRVADGQLRVQISVQGNDEIADLGNAFNDMTTKLDNQFSSLEAMAEIDRQILSSFDSRKIVETVVVRAGELTDCLLVAMLEINDKSDGAAYLSYSWRARDRALNKSSVDLRAGDHSVLAGSPSQLLDAHTAECPEFLEILARERDQPLTFLALPIMIEEKLAATLLFAYAANALPHSDEQVHLRKFADHLTVAFSNSRWEARLYEQAHYDSLTGLPNRVLLADRLGQALKGAERNQKAVALVFVDLDEFKFVNDSLGHAAGDQLLKICATRLTDSVRTEDTVVRFGGDEFVIVVPDIDGSEADVIAEVDTVVSKVLESLQHSTTIEGVEIQSRASLGIALYPDDGSSSEELTARADAAMYDAKASGRNCYRFYKPEMNAAAMRRLGFREEVRRAIKNDEFRLYYQPKHDCASDELVGAEALIRWQHPKHGFVPPIEFIELAEQMGCITEIGAWVLKKACEDIVSWRAQGLSTVKISVNLSPRQFQGSDVVSLVSEQLHAYCLEASSLEFEVTETALMDNAGESINILRRLRELGVGLSIDDFGTGYSSLGYLKDLPVDVLKIDRSFVVTMLEDARVEAIVSSIISLAHNLGLTVVAEGVETPEEKAKLLELGCDLCQGYLYNPPLKCAEFTELLAFSSGRAAPAQDYQL